MKKIVLITGIAIGCLVGTISEAQVFVKIRPIVPVMAVRPVCPSPAHVWVDGEWRWSKRRHEYVWADGFWIERREGRHGHHGRRR